MALLDRAYGETNVFSNVLNPNPAPYLVRTSKMLIFVLYTLIPICGPLPG